MTTSLRFDTLPPCVQRFKWRGSLIWVSLSDLRGWENSAAEHFFNEGAIRYAPIDLIQVRTYWKHFNDLHRHYSWSFFSHSTITLQCLNASFLFCQSYRDYHPRVRKVFTTHSATVQVTRTIKTNNNSERPLKCWHCHTKVPTLELICPLLPLGKLRKTISNLLPFGSVISTRWTGAKFADFFPKQERQIIISKQWRNAKIYDLLGTVLRIRIDLRTFGTDTMELELVLSSEVCDLNDLINLVMLNLGFFWMMQCYRK